MKEDIKNKAYQLVTMLGEIDNETRRTGRVDMSVDEFNEIYGLATEINEGLIVTNNGLVVTNSNIAKVAEIARKLGLKVSYDTNLETDDIIIDFTVILSSVNTYTFYIEVTPNANAKEISDQLYMFAEDFDTDVKPELEEDYDYDEVEIHDITCKVYDLYKEHLASLEEKDWE